VSDNDIATNLVAMSNTTRESLWMGYSNTALIGNLTGDGGGLFLTNRRTGTTYDFGNPLSLRFGMNGHKFSNTGVYCPAGQTTWAFNTLTANTQQWNYIP
jgi:hypothetical protein